MLAAFLIGLMCVCAVQAIRSGGLITSALWLAGTSALLAIVLYLFGATQVAVIELSVGAGLVTVLFVFAISVAGEEVIPNGGVVPRPLAWGLVGLAVALLGWLVFASLPGAAAPAAQTTPTNVLWQDRGLDVLVQVVVIFAGALGLLGLLAEAKPPLEGSAAEEVAALRQQDLRSLEAQAEPALTTQEKVL